MDANDFALIVWPAGHWDELRVCYEGPRSGCELHRKTLAEFRRQGRLDAWFLGDNMLTEIRHRALVPVVKTTEFSLVEAIADHVAGDGTDEMRVVLSDSIRDHFVISEPTALPEPKEDE